MDSVTAVVTTEGLTQNYGDVREPGVQASAGGL